MSKGRQHPLLVQSYNTQGKEARTQAKLKAAKQFIEIMVGSGVPYEKARLQLTQEERDAIDEERFIETQKKKYGRK